MDESLGQTRGYPGRPLHPDQTYYVPVIAVDQCLAATGDLAFFAEATDDEDGDANPPSSFGVISLLLWGSWHSPFGHPGLEWIIHQQLGDTKEKILEKLRARRPADPSVLVHYMRGPPEAAPALDPELSVGEVSEQVQYKYFSRYRELFLRTTSPRYLDSSGLPDGVLDWRCGIHILGLSRVRSATVP